MDGHPSAKALDRTPPTGRLTVFWQVRGGMLIVDVERSPQPVLDWRRMREPGLRKALAEAVEYLEKEHGWKLLRKTRHYQLFCSHGCCIRTIATTPRDPERDARTLLREASKCAGEKGLD